MRKKKRKLMLKKT